MMTDLPVKTISPIKGKVSKSIVIFRPKLHVRISLLPSLKLSHLRVRV
jgi:hypothetical protein